MEERKGLQNMIKTAFVPIIVYYFAHQISAMFLLTLVSRFFPKHAGNIGSFSVMLAKMLAMILAGALVSNYYWKEQKIRYPNTEKAEVKIQFNYMKKCIIAIAGAVFSLGFNYLFARIGLTESSANYSQVAMEQFSYGLLPALFFYGVVSPVIEEMVFRGIVYSSLKRNLNMQMAMLGSALLFGAMHGNLVQMLYGTIMGIVMAILYEKYDKLLAPILFHGAANMAIYICVYFAGT